MEKEEESFGVIPLRKERGRWEVFLIQHRRSGYWGFPKGHAEPNETAQQSAFRELKEETNLELASLVQEESLSEQYYFMLEGQRVHKTVSYFVAQVKGNVRLQKQEIHDGKWVAFPEAIHQVTHQEGKALLIQVENILKSV